MDEQKKSEGLPLQRFRSLKACGILLFLMLSITILVPITTVNATQTKGAVIWGSESSDATLPPPDQDKSWRKHTTEIDLQNTVANTCKNLFINCGYDGAFDKQGVEGSNKDDILAQIETMNNNFDSIVVIDFDHGVGRPDYSLAPDEFHYLFEDQGGTIIGEPGREGIEWDYQPDTAVYDMDIYPRVSEGKVTLAFINTCLSAKATRWYYDNENDTLDQWVEQGLLGDPPNQRAQGMPFAWTHRTVQNKYMAGFNIAEHMSNNGYNHPDLGGQCYIGFSSGSASLMQEIPYPTGTWQYYQWVNEFFSNLLEDERSVNDALDEASETLWGESFHGCPLRDFTSCWWYSNGNDDWNETMDHCTMEIYGNGRIRPTHHLQNILSISAGTGGTTTPSPGNYYYDSNTTEVEVSAESDYHYAFDFWLLDGEFYSRDTTITVTTDGNHELYAVFKFQNKLEISAGEGGTTDPSPGTYWCDPGTPIEVTAEPDDTYEFDYWVINGEDESEDNPITGTLDQDATLHAVFEGPPPPIPVTVIIDSVPYDGYPRHHALTVDNQIPQIFWTGDWYNQNQDAIIAITSQTVHYEETFYLPEGYHDIEYAVSCWVGYWHATITVDGQVVAEQDADVYNHVTAQIYVGNNPPVEYSLDISAGYGGTTNPSPDTYYYVEDSEVQVQAYATEQYYYFDHWNLDGGYYSNNPTVTVTMNTNHDLDAVFTYDPPPPPEHDLTVLCYDQYNNPGYVSLYIDSEYMGLTMDTYSVEEGQRTLQVPDQVGDHYFYAWYYDGDYHYNNPITVSVYADKTVTACYLYNP
jgi:hypothetical protein